VHGLLSMAWASAEASGFVRRTHSKVVAGMHPEEKSILTVLGMLTGTFWVILLGFCLYMRCWKRPKRPQHRKLITAADVERHFPVTRTSDAPTCVVCLSLIEADDPCRVTQCGHAFHADCVLEWWMFRPRKVLRCPVCRQKQSKDVPATSAATAPESQNLPHAQQASAQMPGHERLEMEDADEVAAVVASSPSTPQATREEPVVSLPHSPMLEAEAEEREEEEEEAAGKVTCV